MVSLKRRGSRIASGREQLAVLNEPVGARSGFPKFVVRVGAPLTPTRLEIFQLNLGKMCNQTCKHCHVDAGPDRKEIMSREIMERCLDVFKQHPMPTVDLTGGAPELNPNFRWLVAEVAEAGKNLPNFRLIDRCNLTILTVNDEYRQLPEFFAEHRINVVSSLPHFTKRFTDRQRGEGVFDRSLEALKMLNEIGYGRPESGLQLDLVYNPSGAFLPGRQSELESQFRAQLAEAGIVFNSLYALANLPISRFLDYLLESGNLDEYLERLVTAFNPTAVKGVMCRNTLSVGWDGKLYDCDFNQMLDLELENGMTIESFDWDRLHDRVIVTDQHCYGCTAGSGSSCGGALVE
ncbi:MAG: arsenosugar biosynthesis radical SAM (seleno)protein ArsS [Bdellovibrionota bacterium]